MAQFNSIEKDRRLLCIMGLSGSGKTTVGNILLANKIPKIITHTTRDERISELDGKDYWFVSREEFAETPMIESDTYAGNLYGTSRKEIEKKFKNHNLVFEVVTYTGYQRLKYELEEKEEFCQVIPVYIKVSRETYVKRLAVRGDSLSEIQSRIQINDAQAHEYRDPGYTITNDMSTIIEPDPKLGISLLDQVEELIKSLS